MSHSDGSNYLSNLFQLPAAFNNLICKNKKYYDTLKRAAKVSKTDVSVCIYGESGSGKEVIATAIHKSSPRASHPFIKVNCGAIPDNLFESELFGYAKGAFTGANSNGKIGKIAMANNGTLFLDEIGELPLSLQVKLLRVLQDKEITRIGGTTPEKINFRLIAATNKDLPSMIADKTFREDLYYRINVVPIMIPPLRERKEDIPILVNNILHELNISYNTDLTLNSEAMDALIDYPWPGNVRQMINVMEQIVVLASNHIITVDDLPFNIKSLVTKPKINSNNTLIRDAIVNNYDLASVIEFTEKELIVSALNKVNNNKTKAIKLLGISRRCFYQKLSKYNICS